MKSCKPTSDLKTKDDLIRIVLQCKDQIKLWNREEGLKKELKKIDREEEQNNISRLEGEFIFKRERERAKEEAEQEVRQLKSTVTKRT